MFNLLMLLSAPPALAANPMYDAGGYPHYNVDLYGVFLDDCEVQIPGSVDWNRLISAQVKAGVSGNDQVDEYASGWVYPALADQVSITLYEDAGDTAVGAALAWDSGAESVSGDITDIEPVLLVRPGDSCASPALPYWFVRVTTVNAPGGFLARVR
jgi:hypothetical protein